MVELPINTLFLSQQQQCRQCLDDEPHSEISDVVANVTSKAAENSFMHWSIRICLESKQLGFISSELTDAWTSWMKRTLGVAPTESQGLCGWFPDEVLPPHWESISPLLERTLHRPPSSAVGDLRVLHWGTGPAPQAPKERRKPLNHKKVDFTFQNDWTYWNSMGWELWGGGGVKRLSWWCIWLWLYPSSESNRHLWATGMNWTVWQTAEEMLELNSKAFMIFFTSCRRHGGRPGLFVLGPHSEAQQDEGVQTTATN